MKYSGVLLSVKDIHRSRKFYEELFGLTVLFDYGINIAFQNGIALQQDFDWLTDIPKENIVDKSNNFELCFEEEDFEGFLLRLKDYPEIHLVHDVKEYSWGQRVIRFYDLDNHIIEVGENMKVVVKRFMDSGLSIEETAKRMGITVADVELINS